MIHTEKYSTDLRNRGIDLANRKILVTRFFNSNQEKDLEKPPNCNGFGRIHHFKRFISDNWPINPLPTDPACKALNISAPEILKVQLFQNAICSWRCWYCFVDEKLKVGNRKYSDFKSTDELIELYLNESEIIPIIDISGGQPDLVPEWTLWFMKSLEKRNLQNKIYLWSDDNLSNDYISKYLSKESIKFMSDYKNYGRVGCFKGFDKASFTFNTRANPDYFNLQFIYAKKMSELFDFYGYITLTHNSDYNLYKRINDFIDLIQEKIHPLFPLRVIPLKIIQFTPNLKRIKENQEKALSIQNIAVEAWKEELSSRFTIAELNKPIYEHEITL